MHALPSPTPYPPPQEDNCDQSEKINTIKTDLMLGRLGGGEVLLLRIEIVI